MGRWGRTPPSPPLWARAVVAFIALPGVVAIAIPGVLLRPDDVALRVVGVVPLTIGLSLLLWCVRDFLVAGKGTLAPWSPPVHLVAIGLYRFTRNPMYVAVLVMLCGWAIAYDRWTLWWYAGVVALLFHWRVRVYEEPRLAAMYGRAWDEYRIAVPRWLWRAKQ